MVARSPSRYVLSRRRRKAAGSDTAVLPQAARGGIIVETERSTKRTTSRLTVSDVRQEDTGNYTCKPSNTKSHSISLIVVEGK